RFEVGLGGVGVERRRGGGGLLRLHRVLDLRQQLLGERHLLALRIEADERPVGGGRHLEVLHLPVALRDVEEQRRLVAQLEGLLVFLEGAVEVAQRVLRFGIAIGLPGADRVGGRGQRGRRQPQERDQHDSSGKLHVTPTRRRRKLYPTIARRVKAQT